MLARLPSERLSQFLGQQRRNRSKEGRARHLHRGVGCRPARASPRSAQRPRSSSAGPATWPLAARRSRDRTRTMSARAVARDHAAPAPPGSDPRIASPAHPTVRTETASRMPTAPSKLAIVVRGGWDGHAPIEATDLFIPHLEANGYEVRIFDSPAPYADPDLMARTDLIMQCNTMATIARDELAGLRAAIANGTGMAGWHGGIADSYRNSSDYFQLIGAQFACHPGKDPALITAPGPENNYLPY